MMVIDCATFPRTVSLNLGESMSSSSFRTLLVKSCSGRSLVPSAESLSHNVYLIAMWDRVGYDSHASVGQSSSSSLS